MIGLGSIAPYWSPQALVPEVTSVSPAFGPEAGSTVITINGLNFDPAATVEVDGVAAGSVVWVNATRIDCFTPPGAFGPADVVVFNPSADSGASGDAAFAYYALIDFAALSDGTMSQGSFLSATGLSSFTRADSTPSAQVTVQDSATTVVAGIAANVARLYNDGTHRGFLVEQRTVNFVPGSGNAPRDITAGWIASAQGTQSAAFGNGPDGTAHASRLNMTGTNQISNYADLGSDTAVRWTYSAWQRSKDASTNGDMQIVVANAANSASSLIVRAASNTWARLVVSKGTNLREYVFTADTYDRSGQGGQAAHVRDVLTDFMQLEPGDFATSVIAKAGGVREQDLAAWTMPSSSSRIRLYARFRPLFASTSQVIQNNISSGLNVAETQWYLYESTTSSYLYVKDSDKKLYCKVAGGTEVASTNAIAFAAFDDVELLIEVGNNVATRLKYRLNGGSWVDLAMAAIPGDATPGADVTLMSSAASGGVVFPCLLRELRAYPVEITEADL